LAAVDDHPYAAYSAVLSDAEHLLDEIDDALSRLEHGTYGTCEHCRAPIGADRLAELPLARTCGSHPQLADSARRAPAGDGPVAVDGPPAR